MTTRVESVVERAVLPFPSPLPLPDGLYKTLCLPGLEESGSAPVRMAARQAWDRTGPCRRQRGSGGGAQAAAAGLAPSRRAEGLGGVKPRRAPPSQATQAEEDGGQNSPFPQPRGTQRPREKSQKHQNRCHHGQRHRLAQTHQLPGACVLTSHKQCGPRAVFAACPI